MNRLYGTIFLLVFPLTIYAQVTTYIQKLELKIDTLSFIWPENIQAGNNKDQLRFPYSDEDEVCEVKVWPRSAHYNLSLLYSGDFELIDSMIYTNNYYRFKVRFHDLTKSAFLKFSFAVRHDSSKTIIDVPLQPYTNTYAKIYPKDDELYIGEEKIFEIVTNNAENISFNNDWTHGQNIDYRITEQNGTLYLHLVPNKTGTINLQVPLTARKPHLTDNDQLSNVLPPISYTFTVKSSRLQFLNIDEKEITVDNLTRTEGIEVQIENSRLLQVGKTYRIENQESPGGPLIAELFTKQLLANNRVLCILRPYNYHKKSDGYLYIKDGDVARFITNFSITHTTEIDKISILHDGSDWKESNIVYPGETAEIKLEGKGLQKAKFYFEGLTDITQDTLVRSESQAVYTLRVPMDISKKTINIYNHNHPTGKFLKVDEYQRPRDFDYMYVDYGDLGRKVSGIRGPVLYQSTLKDVVLSFNTNQIDRGSLYGKQYLNINVKVTGKKNNLIEMATIKDIAVCPSVKSPRYEYYPSHDCNTGDISLNKYLSKKTYDLEGWSKISMSIRNDPDKYGEQGYKRDVDIILKRKYSFDVEVSFPAGLITISKQTSGADSGKIGFGNLSGISMAMIAQFSFYNPNKIAKYRPYKIGAGFLAFNAFNFSNNASNRDVGIVVLGSIYPTTRDVKLTFPLYVGGGYFLKAQRWFFLVGPGIRVTL